MCRARDRGSLFDGGEAAVGPGEAATRCANEPWKWPLRRGGALCPIIVTPVRWRVVQWWAWCRPRLFWRAFERKGIRNRMGSSAGVPGTALDRASRREGNVVVWLRLREAGSSRRRSLIGNPESGGLASVCQGRKWGWVLTGVSTSKAERGTRPRYSGGWNGGQGFSACGFPVRKKEMWRG
jgi:hypothetical protein